MRQRISVAADHAGRSADAIRLLAVSKGHSADKVLQVAACGMVDFGENYAREAAIKIDSVNSAMQEDMDQLCWHFIGTLQANKTSLVANRCDWVHSVDRLRIARRLSVQRDADLPPINICLQVNIDADAAKSGVAPADLPSLAEAVLGLPRLRLRGLMAMPSLHGGRRAAFARTRDCMEKLCRDMDISMDTLSMGTSNDFEDAIDEGATVVRVGTALFGPRIAATAADSSVMV